MESPQSVRPILADAAREVELKLAVRGDAFARLSMTPPLLDASASPVTTVAMEAAYYDTPDLQLHRKGLSLRVRNEDGKFIQTLKAPARTNGSAATFDRHEWSAPVPGFAPDLSLIDDPRAKALLGDCTQDDLAEMFHTRMHREIRYITHETGPHKAAIEIAFDQGTLTAANRIMPISEVELELKGGDPAALYALARRFQEVAPLRVETNTKPARGYALVGGTPAVSKKVDPDGLDAEISADGALAAILRANFTNWLANEAAALDGSDPEGVHQMRVTLRRMRAALRVYSDILPRGQLDWLNDELKWLAGALGPARDWDVFLTELLPPVEEQTPDDPGLAVLRQSALGARAGAYGEAYAAVRSPRYAELVLRFGEWLERAGWRDGCDGDALAILDGPLSEVSGDMLQRQYRKARKRGRKLADAAPERRHQLRITLKRLRYVSEFFTPLYTKKAAGKLVSSVRRLQNTLGHFNDLTTAEARLGVLTAERTGHDSEAVAHGAGLVRGWYKAHEAGSTATLMDDWRAFRDIKTFWRARPGEA